MIKIDIMLRYIIKKCIRLLLKVLYIVPVKKNKIFFVSFMGKEYSCNPKYITEYIINENINKYEIYWAFNNPSEFNYLKEKKINIVKYNSLMYLIHVLSSKIFITNNTCQSFIPFRKQQYIINTWHAGGIYKKVGFQHPFIDWEMEIRYKDAIKMVDLYLSSSDLFTKYLIHDSFGYTGEVLKCGLPRNDIFFYHNKSVTVKVKNALNIPLNRKVILYAPTHRGEKPFTDYQIDYDKVCKAISQKFGDNWVVLVRAHNYFIDKFHKLDINKKVINVSSYADMQELLLTTDILITDYSSCMWDFSLLYRPCFLYATDLDYYTENTGFYIEIDKWPFPVALDNEQLFKNIKNFDEEKYIINIKKYHKDMGSYEKGNASIKIVERILKIN